MKKICQVSLTQVKDFSKVYINICTKYTLNYFKHVLQEHFKINVTWCQIDGWSSVVTSRIGNAVIIATVQTNAIMYLAWCLLALGFNGHIIAMYLSTLMATNVYALTCKKYTAVKFIVHFWHDRAWIMFTFVEFRYFRFTQYVTSHLKIYYERLIVWSIETVKMYLDV